MKTKYAFRLDLLKKTVKYWWSQSKISLLGIIILPIWGGANLTVFLKFDLWIKWLNFAAAIFVLTMWIITYKKYLSTIFRIISGRCIRDMAALKFEIAVDRPVFYKEVECPICKYKAVIHFPYQNPFTGKPETLQIENRCYYCGFKFEIQ